MASLRVLVQDFGWIHTGLGAGGNFAFLVGSVFFLPVFEPLKTLGVWLFIIGAFFMLVGSLGELAVKLYEARGKSQWHEKSQDERERKIKPTNSATA